MLFPWQLHKHFSHNTQSSSFFTSHYFPFFSFLRESPIIPQEKSINGCLNQWHLKSRWHSSFSGKAISTNTLAMWWKTGRIILALGKGWVHITTSNFGEKRECTLEIHRRLTRVITYSSYLCFPWAHCVMEALLWGKQLSFQQRLWWSHVKYFANFLIRCNLYRRASSDKQDKDCWF